MTDEVIEQQEPTNPAQDASERVPEHDEAARQEESATSDDSADTAADSDKGEKPRGGFQKRISELTANWRATERRAEFLERQLEFMQQQMQKGATPEQPQQQPQTPAKPSADQFQDYEQYLEALADWKAEVKLTEHQQRQAQEAKQREQQQTYQQRVQTFQQRSQEFAAQAPDFQAVAFNPNVPITDAMQEAILDSDMGPQVAYHLGQHPDEAARIARMNPYAAAREIGRIEARLAIPPKPKVSQAPDPLKPVGGGGEGRNKSPADMDINEWMAWRNKQIS